jgi:UDP-2,3-diacylglucosamine hydrolase
VGGSESGARDGSREARLLSFLRSLPGWAESLYVVGDLFDFWFEYRMAIPRRYFELLRALRDIRERGVAVTILAGNHDFWLGHFLGEELGLETRDGPLELRLQGRRIWLHHGDGLIGGDLGYKLLKRVVRSPISIGLYRWIHPDLGLPLAHWCSKVSRGSREHRPLDGERLFRDIAAPRFAEGFDAVMIGHFHHAFERRDGERVFYVLGDWMERFTYVELEGGVFRMRSWPGPAALGEGDGDVAAAHASATRMPRTAF